MEERYEMRGKLGQGGLGTVFRAWDHALKRDVAVKRIASTYEGSQREEATRQMEKETGALAALQHPNIVTIFDVGADEDGPFVVMELLTGQTLDDVVARAPLTWQDFRELALQIQEALVAAQDLGLVHRDLKPSNIMLNWLPSGRFQAKVVDFGLAKFSPKPSAQTVDQSDAVFGSIFYMAPEQFERGALDARVDMYSIGCVYYFTLTGESPFQGDTGPQVMAAHLEHRVVPLAQLRPDLPRWVSDWVMWHINRHATERPANARESLKTFIQLDVPATQTMSTGEPQPEAPKRPRLIIPGAAAPAPVAPPVPEPVITQAAPQPLAPPVGAPPSLHSTAPQAAVEPEPSPVAPPPAQAYVPAPPPPPPPPPPAPAPVPVAVAVPVAAVAPPPQVVATPTAQIQPAAPVTASTVPLQPAAAAPTPAPGPQIRLGPAAAAPVATARATPQAGPVAGSRPGLPKGPGQQTFIPVKKGIGNGAKAAIAAVLGVIVIVVGFMIAAKSGQGKATEKYNRIVKEAADPSAKEVMVNAEELGILLNSVITPGSNTQRETIYKALYLAKASDGTNIDDVIVEAATRTDMNSSIRQSLLARVVGQRKNPSVVPKLLTFARNSNDAAGARAALEAVTTLGGDDHFAELLDVIQFTADSGVRQAAEASAGQIITKSAKKSEFAATLATAYAAATNDDTRHALLRLLGRAGGEQAGEVVTKALKEGKDLDKLNAVLSLQQWGDDSMFSTLTDFIEETEDENLRGRAFKGALGFLMDKTRKRSDEENEDFWKTLASSAKTSAEQLSMVRGLANAEPTEWAMSVVEYFFDESDSDEVQDLADKALSRMRERAKALGKGGGDEEEEEDEEKKDEEEDEEEEE
jgi:serine/threonine protein kinase